MEKILKDITSLICNKFQFSFHVDENGAFEIIYNDGKGRAKIMLDNYTKGRDLFLETLENHKNRIAVADFEEIKEIKQLERDSMLIEIMQANELKAAAMTVNASGELEVKKEAYTVTNDLVYFDKNTYQAGEFKKGMGKAFIVTVARFTGIKLLKHAKINGSTVSLLYKNFMFEFDEVLNGENEILAAIEKIKRDGLKNILKQAEEGYKQSLLENMV